MHRSVWTLPLQWDSFPSLKQPDKVKQENQHSQYHLLYVFVPRSTSQGLLFLHVDAWI